MQKQEAGNKIITLISGFLNGVATDDIQHKTPVFKIVTNTRP